MINTVRLKEVQVLVVLLMKDLGFGVVLVCTVVDLGHLY